MAHHQKRPTATALLCELTKLKSQQKYLDTDQKTEHNQANLLPDDVLLLRSTLASDLQQFKRTTYANIDDCRRQLQTFIGQTASADPHRLDMKALRDEVLRLDTLIRSLQVASDVRPLRDAFERMLSPAEGLAPNGHDGIDDGTGIVNDTLLLNEMPTKPWPSAAARKSVSSCGGSVDHYVSASEHRDVRRFLDLLCGHGGHSGGWSDPEHQLYVKAKAKYGTNVERIVESMRGVMGNVKSESEIIDHDKWFGKYCECKQRYKSAIAEWKQNLK